MLPEINITPILTSILPAIVGFIGLLKGMEIQQKKEAKRQMEEIYIREGLEKEILHLIKLRDSLVYDCLFHFVFYENTPKFIDYLREKIKLFYNLLEPQASWIRIQIYGEEFYEALETVNFIIRKQIYSIEKELFNQLTDEQTTKKSRIVLFEIEAMLHFIISKFIELLNILEKEKVRSISEISKFSEQPKMKKIRQEMKSFTQACLRNLHNKELDLPDFLTSIPKITKERLRRMGLLVETLGTI